MGNCFSTFMRRFQQHKFPLERSGSAEEPRAPVGIFISPKKTSVQPQDLHSPRSWGGSCPIPSYLGVLEWQKPGVQLLAGISAVVNLTDFLLSAPPQ